MRVRHSHLIAAGLALGLAGWLVSGQLDGSGRAGETAPEAARDASEAPVPAVRVREIQAEPVARELVLNGRTAAARAVQLRAETDGRVVALGAERGRAVNEGEVLITLDPRERRAVVSQAEATLRQREMEHDAATRLGAQGFQAETRVAEAKAALEAAQAALERARLELAHTEIRAPFDGVLEQRPVEIGDFVDIGDTVALVLEQDPYLVVAEAAQKDVGHLAVGMPGTARLVTGAVVEGRLRYVASRADPATRTFQVELEVANPDRRFPAGVTAELRIAYADAPAHRIPASLLALDDQGRLGIKAVDDDGVVVFHPADVVRAEADAVWLAGLPERLLVITVGHGFVRPGDTVRPVPEDALATSGPLVAEAPG